MEKFTQKLPTFNDILPQNIESNLDKILEENRIQLDNLLKAEKFTWNDFIQPLEDMEVRLHNMWAIVSHLNNVKNNKPLQEVYQHCLLKLTEYVSELSQNEKIFHAYEDIKKKNQESSLDPAQQKIIDNTLLDFKLSGVHFSADKKKQFLELQKRLAKLENQFEQNLLDATDAWKKLIIDERELNGLPEDAKFLAKNEAEREGKAGWILTLQIPSYLAIMTHAENRSLREEMYHAYVTRASDLGNNKFDNTKVMEEILLLRQQKAELLGYKNFAELSLVKKMAKDPERVLNFLNEILDYAKPKAQTEWNELKDFALKKDGLDHLQTWDVAFYSEKLREQQFNISQEELRPYFSIDQVLTGMFYIAEKLFGVKILQKTGVDTWHPDVRFYEMFDVNQNLMASFYLDLYARPQKRGGAWMDHCYDRHLDSQQNLQKPVTFLVCNFTPPSDSKPALLTHDEVLTLFHEFGHGIHHMLTKINYTGVSGLNNVAWDAVEFPSQFMENFCWEKPCLDLFAKHYQTGETLPQAMLDRLIASKNYHSGLHTVRQLEFALFDFELHIEQEKANKLSIQTLLNDVRKKVCVIPVPSYNRFQHSFSHIFAGGYAAGYYSYKWAEVLAADAYEIFEEQGILNSQLGQRLEETFLSQGGAKDALDLYIDFRGREPSINALLIKLGMK